MMIRKYFLTALLIATNALASTKTVELVVPYAPGGTADKFAQIIMPALKAELAKENIMSVIVYRPGAGSVTGIASVAKNDQLQLVITSNSVITAPILNKLPNSYNIAEDLEVVAYLGHLPLIMVTNTASGIRSFADVQQQCRDKKFNYASGGPGTAGHLGSALVFDRLNCNTVHVPYKGMGPMLNALLGNHSPVGSDFVSGVKPLIDDNKLIPLLVLDRNRLDSMPKVPSLTDIGMDDKFDNWFVIMSNRVGSAQQISQVSRAVTTALNNPDILAQLRSQGLRDTGVRKPRNFLIDEQQNLIRFLKNIKIDE
jgi:tripartite-type tricarboxylate transporter receptor subunit TctC